MSEAADEWNEIKKRDEKILQSFVSQLAEHFDTVQVICTRRLPEEGGTIIADRGAGNWYARYGSLKEWVVKQEEQMRVEQRPED